MYIHRAHWVSTLVLAGMIVSCTGFPAFAPSPTEQPTGASATATPSRSPRGSQLEGEARRRVASLALPVSCWPKTDFSTHSVPYEEFTGGGCPGEGIPAIDDPSFVPVEEADGWLDDREPVQVLDIKGDARAYPIQIMIWHEVVNDTVAGLPVVINY